MWWERDLLLEGLVEEFADEDAPATSSAPASLSELGITVGRGVS